MVGNFLIELLRASNVIELETPKMLLTLEKIQSDKMKTLSDKILLPVEIDKGHLDARNILAVINL